MDPSVDPTKIPAAAPPPGLKPNFIDPASRGSQVVAAAVALPTIAFVLVCARVYTRIFVSRAFGLDDGIAVVGMGIWQVLSIVYAILTIKTVHYGFGRHIWDVTLADVLVLAKFSYGQHIVLSLLPYAIKLSILVMYLRIFRANSTFARVTRCLIAFLVIWSFTLFMAVVLKCIPVAAAWDPTITEKRCIHAALLGFVSSIIGAVTDLLVLVLPIPLLLQLQLPSRKRLGLVVVFGAGGIATALAFVRVSVYTDFRTVDQDPTWDYVDRVMWGLAEFNIGIMTSSCPPLQPLMRMIPGGSIFSITRARTSGYPRRSSGASKARKGSGSGWSKRKNRTDDSTVDVEHLTSPGTLELGNMGAAANETTVQGFPRADSTPHSVSVSNSEQSLRDKQQGADPGSAPRRGIMQRFDVEVTKS